MAIIGTWYLTQSFPETNIATFSLEVNSRPLVAMKGEQEIPLCMPGQKVVFLVVVTDTGEGSGIGEAVDISVTTSGAEVSINNLSIRSGEIAEVVVIPDEASVSEVLTIMFKGERKGFKQTETYNIQVIDWEDDLVEEAAQMRDKFVSWLATNHPGLGITSETEWTGTIVNPSILVVMHYMFFSEDWEMYLTWHVMVPPYDWTRIYLRPRYTETNPTMAIEISSVQGQTEPHFIELPDWV